MAKKGIKGEEREREMREGHNERKSEGEFRDKKRKERKYSGEGS